MLLNRIEIALFDLVEEVDRAFHHRFRLELAKSELHLPPFGETVLDRANLERFDEARTRRIEIGEARNPLEPVARFLEAIRGLAGETRQVRRVKGDLVAVESKWHGAG